MKKKTEGTAGEKISGQEEKKITRKEAIRKSGYIALSAATTVILLGSPNKAQAALTSPTSPPPWP